MKLKINKEMLLKNRFWILLAVSVGLIITGIFYLQFSVDADEMLQKNRKALTASINVNKGPFDNDTITKAKEEAANRAEKAKAEVWLDAYKVQADLFRWPARIETEFEWQKGRFANAITLNKLTPPESWPADTDSLIHGQIVDLQNDIGKDWLIIKPRKGAPVKIYRTENVKNVMVADVNKSILFHTMVDHPGKLVTVTYQKGRFFNEPLTDTQHEVFAESYKSQIHEILESVDPLDEKGNGVVQLRNWLYRKDVFPDGPFFRYVNKDWDPSKNFSADAWIAQENLWIQKEIYRIIGEVNRSISGFARDKKNKDVYENANFELTLLLQKDRSLKFTIKNLKPRRQRLDLNFRVKMNDFESEVVLISGLPLAPKGESKDTYTQVIPCPEKLKRTGIFKVEQVLGWESAAVKRIDQISIGANEPGDISQSHRTFPEPLVGLDPVAVVAPADPKVMPVRPPVGGGPGLPPAGRGGRERYFEVSEQSRRVPIAIVLIVDQSQVDRIMTAFNNSKLRFLETQVLLNQYTGSLQPPVAADKLEGVGGVPNFPLGPRMVPPMGPRPPIGAVPAGGGGGGGGELEANMEIVLYGIMTLYERYPPRPASENKQQ